MDEVFKPIEGFPGYYISNLGRVQSRKRTNPIIVSTSTSRLGYKMAVLWNNNKLMTLYIGRTVLAAFEDYPADPWLCYCHHKNGDLEDCRLDNLEWIVCETTADYDPSKSHRKGVLKPKFTKDRMTEAKYNQSRSTIEKAVMTRTRTIELRNLLKAQDKVNGK